MAARDDDWQSWKVEGTRMYTAGDLPGAMAKYERAAELAEQDGHPEGGAVCWSNAALMQLRMCTAALERGVVSIARQEKYAQALHQALAFALRACELDPSYVKAHHRKFKALEMMGRKEEATLAMRDFKQLEMIGRAPSNASATEKERLPIWQLAQRLQHKCMMGRVTLIMGETGCGKSTQLPQILLECAGGKILCTQPRRLAVVAIATRVAQERGCVLGEEVGYQIGQTTKTSRDTQLEFCTAGILLERMKRDGSNVLKDYQVLYLSA
jgi:HrpA-like RNA helicase